MLTGMCGEEMKAWCLVRDILDILDILISIKNPFINSFVSKFEELREVIGNNIDISIIQDSKPNSSFPTNQFGYSEPFRKDRNSFKYFQRSISRFCTR